MDADNLLLFRLRKRTGLWENEFLHFEQSVSWETQKSDVMCKKGNTLVFD